MSGVPASDGSCTLARPASPVWNASVDVLSRTRRNAYTIRGAAPDVTIGRPAAVRTGSASLPSRRHRLTSITVLSISLPAARFFRRIVGRGVERPIVAAKH